MSLTQARIPRVKRSPCCVSAPRTAFVGANSGIMDQFIACFGERDHAVLVDTRSLTHTAVPIPEDVHLVVCNSMVKHSHAGGEYNTRRAEVDEGSRILRESNSRLSTS